MHLILFFIIIIFEGIAAFAVSPVYVCLHM